MWRASQRKWYHISFSKIVHLEKAQQESKCLLMHEFSSTNSTYTIMKAEVLTCVRHNKHNSVSQYAVTL